MSRLLAFCCCMLACAVAHARALDLSGYIDADGAISVQRHGDTVDPYFAMQALLLAHDHGLDVRAAAARWIAWLLPRQKPDATFDRFCRRGPVWGPCKTADADDALHALWMRTLSLVRPSETQRASHERSRRASERALAALRDPARGIYLVSPVYPHGLFMDNLEVWRHVYHANARRDANALAKAIDDVFWNAEARAYRASTQQGSDGAAFYPDAVAQVYPLFVGFPAARRLDYAAWMRRHRADWLRAVHEDFAWGPVAIVALQQHDPLSVGCWLREVASERHGVHWTVTDEAAWQVLQARGARAVSAEASCA